VTRRGHYKEFACRASHCWEVYDGLKDNMTQPKPIKNNVEFLIYTVYTLIMSTFNFIATI